jgi:hypothetical protein
MTEREEDSTMRRWINTWTTTLATAALLGLPIAAVAKPQQPSAPPQQQQPAPQPAQPQPAPQPTQPPPTEPQPAQPQPAQPQPAQPQPAQPQPTQPQPTEPQPTQPPSPTTTQQAPSSTSSDQAVSPEEHLRQARAALNDINAASIPARNRAQFAELRKHLAALENPTAAGASRKAPAKPGSVKADNWGTEVAAIDRIITTLAGSDTAAGASGTSTTGATGTAGTRRGGAASGTMVDAATRAKLMEIRTHITAYAAAKAGASAPRSDAGSTMANEAMTPPPQSANAAATETPRTGNYPANAGQAPSPAPNQPANPPQSTPPQAAAPQSAGTARVDAEAAHRELLAARDALNQLTQLPAAAQLTGDARTQVQQLIANFNELITNNTDWRASYAKVSTSLTALLGPESTTTETPAAAPTATPGAAGTAGAVGTAGTTGQLDPAIRAKLVEMRDHLKEFEKASGGSGK